MRPLVSVLFTTFNHAAYLEQALDSIIAQTFADYELIITDDASSDDSADVIRRWLDRTGAEADFVVHERNLGICATRNRAIARSSGVLVCGLSGDDWYEPDRLARQAPFLTGQSDDVAAVYSDARVVGPTGVTRRESYLREMLGDADPPQGWVFERLHRSNVLPAGAVMMRRSAIDAVGGYDEALKFEDWDMWLRLADRYRFAFLDMTATNRRELPTSLGHAGYRTPPMHRSIVRIQEKWLARDAESARWSAYWMRRSALVIAEEDPEEARAILRHVSAIPARDRVPWAAVGAALALPGCTWALPRLRRAVGRAAPFVRAEIGAWRGGRRLGVARR